MDKKSGLTSEEKLIKKSSLTDSIKDVFNVRELEINFRWVNMALFLGSLCLCYYLAYDYVLKSNLPLERVAYRDLISSVRNKKEAAGLLAKKDYIEIVSRRDIFTPPKNKKSPVFSEKVIEPPAPALPQVDPMEEVKNNLCMVGIIWDAKPQVLIENKKETRTYLLSEGDTIGQFRIKKIFRDKIILESEGREFELI